MIKVGVYVSEHVSVNVWSYYPHRASSQHLQSCLPRRDNLAETVCEQTRGLSRCTSNLHNQCKHKPQLTTASARSPTTAPRPGKNANMALIL